MNTEFYIRKILEILEDKSFYKVLGDESTKQTMKKITSHEFSQRQPNVLSQRTFGTFRPAGFKI